jgi:hypothetical protein
MLPRAPVDCIVDPAGYTGFQPQSAVLAPEEKAARRQQEVVSNRPVQQPAAVRLPDPFVTRARAGLVATLAAACLAGGEAKIPAGPVPAYFRELIEAGNVEFDFYDPKTDFRRYRGFTEFKLSVRNHYAYTYRCDRTRRGGRWQVTIRPTIQDLTCRVAHLVHLPKYLDSDRRWDDRLVKHEFDHVAISVDPRVKMLTEHLLRSMRTIRVDVPRGTAIDDPFIRATIDKEIDKRVDAVYELLADNQEFLDEITEHGAKPISEREAFFRALFTKPNLDRAKFPYAGDVVDRLHSSAYRSAERSWGLDRAKRQVVRDKPDGPQRDAPLPKSSRQ